MRKNKYIQSLPETAEVLKKQTRALMSKTAVLKIRGKRFVLRPFTLAVFVAVIILLICIISAFTSSGTAAVELPFDISGGSRTLASGKGVIAYCNRGAAEIDKRGKVKWTVEKELSEPMAETEGKYFIIADLAGNHYAGSYKNGKLVCEYMTESDIISVKITKDGYAAIASDTDGYKGKVRVYNKHGRETYVWNSGSGYITDIALSENGRYLAVAQLVTSEGACDTRLQIIDTGKGEVIGTADRGGEVGAELKFTSSNKAVMVTDSHIVSYNLKGKQLFDVSLAGKTPSLYSLDSDERIAVVTVDNRGNNVLELYSYSGKKKAAYTAEGDIRALSVRGKSAAVAEQKGLVRVTSGGKGKKPFSVDHDVKCIGLYSGGKRTLVVGTSQGECISLR